MKKFLFVLLTALSMLLTACGYGYDDNYLQNNSKPDDETAAIYLGQFNTIDIYGNSVDESIFADNDLTLINVWTTWCGPCKREVGDLEAVAEAYAKDNIGVIGMLYDGVSTKTFEPIQKTLDNAVLIMETAKADYTVIVPEENLLRGIIGAVTAFPTSFFVDSEGKIVENTFEMIGEFDENGEQMMATFMLGAMDKAGWSAAFDKALEVYNGK